MLRKFIKGKTYIFIDASNIFYSQQTLKWRVDYKKLKKYFEKECDLGAIFFYTGRVGENRKQISFLEKLKLLGYQVRSREVKRIRVGKDDYEWKGDLDVELVIDVMKNLHSFESCVILSGDSDFAALLDEMRLLKKRIIVLSTRGHISKELIERAKYIDLRKLKQEISL